MKLTDQNQTRPTSEKWHYQQHFVYREIADFIYQWIPTDKSEIVIVCIGSDRSTGDALGPITGTHLSKWRLTNYHVYGTLKSPVHALNLTEELNKINESHPQAFIIAIDACLGRATSIGKITASIGPLKPGLALKKKLPEVGHLHITGIVNASTPVDYLTLQNTRLHLVMELAETIARSLLYLQRNYLDKRKQQIN
ncbi:spore protease YyaC [Amphibacillus cookii]|uniref:spore protease YyaC n=1 Tax=Amphibacillus cookii TaxID=767787 RepID=UPI001957F818|nr:spore protease YyaC [Amphibacillus cookii]MBM7541352.1 putative sporulation protein YyaC [Amphibacillus cookii]